ncbi:hypothetical protein [Rubellimicrobium roseum]|uniref:Uncharacterized protein n=1 Tax=Rubellimicrobium roseum TaxID=687525 RepID=A0A5C4N7B6_9RHOB|nr:hypothetical protein [Rubellimicrobium roseum]TNC68016.1 hypothetical protein FHG71_14970 [Rubellimicrobium roseum]
MRTMLLSLVAVTALAAPAWANQCPMLMGQVEERMSASTADEATKAQAATLLEEGRAAHDAGDHATSEAKLNEALALLAQ